MQINNNNYSVLEIIQMIARRELVVNPSYQRSSGIWPDTASAYFIDTIIEGFTFPKIYIYEFLDRSARSIRREIVDGQQRIGAIQRFYANEFSLRAEGRNKGKKFEDLDEQDQEKFLTYSVPVDVIRNAGTADILQMFRRMNSYTMPLNEAEKRHAGYQGAFKWFVNGISDDLNEFFIEYGVFSTRQVTRMADSALIADCVLALERGVISTSARDLDALYKKYDSTFPDAEEYRFKIKSSFDFITENLGDLRGTFMMKPYAMHSLLTGLMHTKFGIESIKNDFGVETIGLFAKDPQMAIRQLTSMAQAHEAKETNGQYGKYVWGCLSTTDRKPRRTARVAAILRALGVDVPGEVDANLT